MFFEKISEIKTIAANTGTAIFVVPKDMAVEIKNTGEVLTAYLIGEIDHHSAKKIRETIDSAAERTSPKKWVLDFRGVTFMDSSGIGLVMGRYKLMSSLGGELEVANVSAHIKKVMKISGLEKFAKIREER